MRSPHAHDTISDWNAGSAVSAMTSEIIGFIADATRHLLNDATTTRRKQLKRKMPATSDCIVDYSPPKLRERKKTKKEHNVKAATPTKRKRTHNIRDQKLQKLATQQKKILADLPSLIATAVTQALKENTKPENTQDRDLNSSDSKNPYQTQGTSPNPTPAQPAHYVTAHSPPQIRSGYFSPPQPAYFPAPTQNPPVYFVPQQPVPYPASASHAVIGAQPPPLNPPEVQTAAMNLIEAFIQENRHPNPYGPLPL